MRTTIVFLALAGHLLTTAPASADPQSDAADRAELARLRKEALSDSPCDHGAIAKQACRAQRLQSIHALIQSRILNQLNTGVQSQDQLLTALRPVIQDEWEAPVSSLRKQLNGTEVVIVGYSILYGATALPNSKVIIEAFRKQANQYEAVAQTGETLDNSLVRLQEVLSPWPDQVWFLAHGQQTGVMQYSEKIRIYSFDGAQFKELWAPPPRRAPVFEIGKDSVQVTYEQQRGPRLAQKLHMTPAGILESVPVPKD